MAKRINRRKQRRRILLLLLCPALIITLVVFNFKRIRLFMNGYDIAEQNAILSMDSSEIEEYFTTKGININLWDMEENEQHYIQYQGCLDFINSYTTIDKDELDIIKDVDAIYPYLKSLKKLGYSETIVESMLSRLNASDLICIVENNFKFKDFIKLRIIKGYQDADLQGYITSGLSGWEAIYTVSYPFIDSSQERTRIYKINNPYSNVALVKPGFSIGNYEPTDLTILKDSISSTAKNTKVRKKVKKALDELLAGAKKENLDILISGGYKVDETPGTNEHQTGLVVDFTSQSMEDHKYYYFKETAEYKWLCSHAYEYGFIQRYPEDKESITGIKNDLYHFRYVGKKAAKEMAENGWTLEEYIQNKGFEYNLTIQGN